MILERAHELASQQLAFGGGYNRNAVRPIPSEVPWEHGPAAVDQFIGEMDLTAAFGLKPGTDFSKVNN